MLLHNLLPTMALISWIATILKILTKMKCMIRFQDANSVLAHLEIYDYRFLLSHSNHPAAFWGSSIFSNVFFCYKTYLRLSSLYDVLVCRLGSLESVGWSVLWSTSCGTVSQAGGRGRELHRILRTVTEAATFQLHNLPEKDSSRLWWQVNRGSGETF
jgi:hypothetical protein